MMKSVTLEALESRMLLSAQTAATPAPLPPINVYAEDARASQVGPDRGLFTFTRSARGKTDSPVTINYALSGTARNGKDYQQLSGSVTIAAGHTWVSLPVIPLRNTFADGSRTVVLTLRASAAYGVGSLSSAVVVIAHGQTTPTPRPQGKWPTAPFHGDPYANSIYVNQLGTATIKGRSIQKAGEIDDYTIFFDDGGSDMTVQSSGRVPTQMAFYSGPGLPTQTAAYGSATGGARFSAPDPPDRRMHYVAVRAADGKSTGSYSLRVHGPAANFIESLSINPRNDAADSGSDISGDGDADFYKFTTTKAGNWTVFVRPDANTHLDAEFLVFDAAGRPVAGTFTRPIDAGRDGATESWTGLLLPANATYFIRVDGHAASLGGYGVAVMKTDSPLVNIAATQPRASSSKPGILTITRAGSAFPLVPLHIQYTISGTARNGIDYARLSGTALFSATATSTTISIKPLAGATGKKTLTITLSPDPFYTLGTQTKAVVTL